MEQRVSALEFRIQQLEKIVSALRSEHIEEVRRRKALEDVIFKDTNVFERGTTAILKKSASVNLNISPSSSPTSKVKKVTKKSTPGVTEKGTLRIVKSDTLAKALAQSTTNNDGTVKFSSANELTQFLDSHNLKAFKHVFGLPLSMDEVKEDDLFLASMFARKDPESYELILEKCDVLHLLNFLFMAEDDSLRHLWKTKTFLRDFIVSHGVFIPIEKFFKYLQWKCSQAGTSSTSIILTKDIIQHYVTYLNDDLLINTQIQKSVKNLANTLQNISSDLAKDITMALNQALKNPRSSLALDLSSSRKIDQVVLVIEPKILAEQLTIVEKRFYHSTETGDFYNRSWSNDGTVSALTKYIAWINKMSGWVMREIIVQHQPAKQAEAIDYFVQVAMILFSLNNFNSTNHIIGGLHSPSVTKLKKAWALISKKTKEDLETVTELLTPKDHYRNYKEHLAKFDPTIHSVIPMLNPPLAELFFNEEVQKTYMDEQCKWINWIKLETLARILWDYKRWKNEYYLEPNESLADFLENSAISWEVNPSYAIAKMKNDSGEDFPPIVPCPFNTGKVNDFYDGNFFTHGEIQLIMLSSESSKIMKPDTVLIARESPVEKIWLIETGEVAIEGLNSANERNQIQKVGKYQLFGHEMLIYSQPKSKLVIGKQNQLPLGQYRSTVWITTIEYVKICDIDPTNLLKLFKTESGLFLKVTKYLLGHLSILSNFKAYCGTTNEEVAQQPDTPETNKKKSKRPPSLLSQKNVSKKNLEDVVKEVPLKEWTCVLSRPTVSLNGTLSVTQNHLCFIQSTNLVKSAKSQKTIVVPMVSIENIRVKANSLTVSREKKGTLEFADFENISEVNEFLGSALSRKLVFKTDQANSGNSSLESSHIRPNISSVDIRQLTEKDWEYINDASSPVAVFKEGGTILSSSDRPNRTIYKVVEGTVTIRDEDAEYTIEKEGFFGIETFVLNCIRNYEVVATATPTKIQLFEGYFLDYLEVYHPVMAARFNLHLAKMIQKKLQTSISKRNNWDPNKT